MQPSGTTLLVIDDDDQVRQRLTAYLEELGCDVLQAATAVDGVALFHDARPELVLCDLHLGSGQGFEVVRQITETGLEVPVIVMCADGAMADAVEALRLGASDFLLNPLHDPEVLSHAVRRALDRARLRLENQRIRERLERANRELEVHLKELRDDQAAGHQVQLNMLPQSPWVSGEYRLEHRLIPSLYLSGDFVDYFRISDTQLGFYLADVSGHGSSSAFVTVLLKFMTTRLMYEQRKSEARATGRIEFKPSDVLGHINRSLINCNLGKHGHLPLPVIYTDGQARYLTGKGRPVGLFEDAEYQNETIELPERFSLTLCSDGVLDCLEGSTLKDKEARLPALIAEHGGTMQGIMAALGLDPNKTMPDDISVLVLSRNAE